MTDLYNFTPGFEQKLLAACCRNALVYNKIGYLLEQDALQSPKAKLICSTLKLIFDEVGSGPGDQDIVFQRLRRIHKDGGVCRDDVYNAIDYIIEIDALPSADALINEAAAELRDRANTLAIESGFENLGEADQRKTIDALERASRIGNEDASLGITLGEHIFDKIHTMRRLDRLPTGILTLDSQLRGGPSRGQLAFWVGGSGDGKSMALNTNACVAVKAGYNVAYATLELADMQVHTRMLACMTGVTINEIEAGKTSLCKQRYLELMAGGGLGGFHVKEFTAQVSQNQEIFDWVDKIEQKTGKQIDLLVVDYADKLAAPAAKGGYDAGMIVYEGLRIWAHENKRWLWTAAQRTRGNRDQQVVDMEHISDSIHKARVADLIVTLLHDDETRCIKFFTAKNRTGESRFSLGPFPSAFEYGSIITGISGSGIVDVHGNEYQSALQAQEVLDVIRESAGSAA